MSETTASAPVDTSAASAPITTSTSVNQDVTQQINNAVNTSSTAAADWTSGLNEDLKGYVQNKGFKDPGMVVDSYRNFEKLMGAPKDRLLKLPEKMDDAEGWKAVYDKLGRPAVPSEYKLEVPKGEEATYNKWKETFHELGLNQKQVDKLMGQFNSNAKESAEQIAKQYESKIELDTAYLKKEWGQAYEKHVAQAKAAAREFEMDGETINKLESAMGFAKVMQLMQKIGSKLGSDTFVSGDKTSGFGGVMTPEMAKNRINALKTDADFVRRYSRGDVAAKDEFDKLHRMAYDI